MHSMYLSTQPTTFLKIPTVKCFQITYAEVQLGSADDEVSLEPYKYS
jgi:hypothetical protein